MKVTVKSHYAIKTALDLATHRSQGVCRVADIARRQGIPRKFLEQILLTLKGGGVVGSKRGIKGGYFLAKPPSKLTVAAIVALMGDPLGRRQVFAHSGGLENGVEAALQEVWQDLGDCISERLEGLTIQKLCTRVIELSSRGSSEYVI
jgi:Rrf2 family iron-sulfur cluster assembly transcriptional regulator